MTQSMTPVDAFVAKWKNGGDERRDAQPFFEDLCRLVGHETPREADPGHTWFMYEAGADKTSGGKGWADVWKKGFFGWEAKGTDRSLEKAYEQLKMYADALQNPPLLVVSDLQTIIVHTNFTNSVKATYKFTVSELDQPEHMRVLRAVFYDPDVLKPGQTRAAVTTDAAEKFTTLAIALSDKGHDAHAVAHFLNRLIFCMFAEDIGLLPKDLFTKMVKSSIKTPHLFEQRSSELFKAMSTGGTVNYEEVKWFNGGLFEDGATLPLDAMQLKLLSEACELEWDEIEPSIFGTLFERGLDPNKRSELGAHYTDPATIMKLVNAVVVEPLLWEWEEEKAALAKMMARATKTISPAGRKRFNQYLERLRAFTVLDPACGSGNFLYLSLRSLKDIEKQVLLEAEGLGLGSQFPAIGPQNVKGIELNDYAAELARITIWIGEIQWMIRKGYGARKDPILRPLQQIQTRDALLNANDTATLWPEADAIVGNPPFIGAHRMRPELGDDYTDRVRQAYEGVVSSGADFVCFWFEKARRAIQDGRTKIAGLVATNSIRSGTNREVLDKIQTTGTIFQAWSDEPWVNEGAAVRVSLICFSNPDAKSKAVLDDREVNAITSSITELVHHDIATAKKLKPNKGISFQGVIPRGELKRKVKEKYGLPDASFVVNGTRGRELLLEPSTPRGEPASDVVFRYWIADDITTRPLDRYIIDFGGRTEADASMFDAAFEQIKTVKLHRQHMKGKESELWWQFGRRREKMATKLRPLDRYISIPRHAKFHLCAWTPKAVVPDSALVVVARADYTSFGILQSRIHGLWALKMGSSLEDRPRYTPSTCFETFPFPEGMNPNLASASYVTDPRAIKIADAAKALDEAREGWLNPSDLCERLPEVVAGYPERINALPGKEVALKKRTLTNLYNANPLWLVSLRKALDEAVAEAYGWTWPMEDEEILQKVFELNRTRANSV